MAFDRIRYMVNPGITFVMTAKTTARSSACAEAAACSLLSGWACGQDQLSGRRRRMDSLKSLDGKDASFLLLILMTNEGSHTEVYRDFQPG